ncbi:hypothetical protein RF11_13946 [Thelohanellus kitauei]|uniref:C2H2-type domain-containing protein n=1 Tax=Thelohanellus kitauei TaxID=669202 RepID=A0A0C2I6Z3_THEKT|nr:hypothetical protein RF11_13946 [Thelohanellus kitauei]
MANHYSHSCHHPGCHQKFSTPQKVEEHAKYIHGLMPHTPDPANTKNIFFFKATKRWKELRNELCKYAVYMKPICRKKSYSYDKAIGNYEGKIPIKAKKQIKDLRLLAEELRKRSTSSAYTSSPPCTEPPEKIPPP